jgi:hypothetical protein
MTQSQPRASRPWYCSDNLCDEYKIELRSGGDYSMTTRLRIARAIIVNLGIISITLFGLFQRADPTVVAPMGLTVLALYNGVEVADAAAFLQAYREVQDDQSDGDGGDSSS